ncbi:MAG: heterocyst frequency control protein PatD [Spirulinaceae cyanobacterium]
MLLMLPQAYSQAYQNLLTALEDLKHITAPANFESTSVKKSFQKLQRIYETEILILNKEALVGAIPPRWQAIQTEIHRAFKLMSMDMMFLASAKKATTSQSRLTNLSDRLSQLIGYCQILLGDEEQV